MSDPTIGINVELNEEQQLAAEFEAIINRAFSGVGSKLGKELSRAVLSAGRAGKGGIGSIGRDFDATFNKIRDGARKTEAEMRRLQERIEKIAAQFRNTGTQGEAFMIPQDTLRRAITQLDRFDAKRDEIAADDSLRKTMSTETSAIIRLLESQQREVSRLATVWEETSRRQREATRVAEQGATTRARAAASERIVLAQQEGARVVAETRAAGSRRVAIIQAVTGQIRALERGLASVFRATANVIGGAASGLAGALRRRESVMSSSFHRQERIVSSSVARQSVQIERLEKRMSSGILGAATGRSQLGALLGGGLAIGGGFAIAGVLRDGITAGRDFVRGLAVMQAQLRLTDEAMEGVRQTALDLGNDITLPGVSAQDAAGAIQILAKQFASFGKQAIPLATSAAKGVLQLSRATGSSAEEAARIVGAAVNVFGIEASKATDVADQFVGALTNAAGVGFDQFSQAFTQGAAVFGQFQLPALGATETLVEFNTALAALAKAGVIGSDAGTALKQFFLQANRGAAPAKEALADIADRAGVMGSVFFDQAGNARALSDSLEILRDGLAGMSDQQRAQTLQTIFGSDAVRVANSLLRLNNEEYDRLRRNIQREGLAAKIARAQNTGLAGAMDALGSVIQTQLILAYEALQDTLGDVVLAIATFTNNLLSGEGVWRTARVALKGLAIGLGSLLVAKVAAEGVQLLGIALRGLLTPFGILGVAAAGVGAAIALLMDASPEFREMMEGLGETIRTKAASAFEFLRDRAADIGDFLAGTVAPKLVGFADLLRTEIIPQIQFRLVAAFRLAAAGVRLFWAKVQPVIQPVIDGFGKLVEAIRELIDVNPGRALLSLGGIIAAIFGGFAVAGPVGAAVAGVGATVGAIFANGLQDEVGNVLSGFGKIILDVLGPVVEDVVDFLKRTFSGDNLMSLADAFFGVVERIGEILGSILTSPQLVTVVAAILAFGVRTGIAFVKGFAEGVIGNLPELGELLVDGLSSAFDAIPQAIFAGLFVALGSAAVLNNFRRTGQGIGKAIADGTRQGLTPGGAGFGAGPRGLIEGLLGGAGNAQREARRVGDAIRDEIGRSVRTLQAAGRNVRFIDFPANAQGLSRIRDEMATLTSEIGTARVAGLQARSAFRLMLDALNPRNTTRLFSGLKTGFGDLRDALSGQGRNIGMAAGTAIAAGLGVAFSAQMVLESKGIGDTVTGLAGIVGSALGALAIGGPKLAGLSLIIGGITAAFQANQAAAQKAKEEVDEYVAALESAEGKELGLSAAQTVLKNLGDESQGVRDLLREVSFNAETFASAIVEGGSQAKTVFADVLESLGQDGLAGKIRDGSLAMGDLVEEIAQMGPGFSDQFFEALDRAGVSLEDLGGLVGFLTDESGELDTALSRFRDRNFFEGVISDAGTAGEAIEKDRGLLREMLGGQVNRGASAAIRGEVTQPAINAQEELDKAKTALNDLLQGPKAGFRGAMDEFIAGLPALRKQIRDTLKIEGAPGEAQLRIDKRNIASQIEEAISLGAQEGALKSVPQVEKKLRGIKADIKAELPEGPARDQILGVISRIMRSLSTSEGLDIMEALGIEVSDADRRAAAVAEALAGGFRGGFAEGFGGAGGDIGKLLQEALDEAQGSVDTSGAREPGRRTVRETAEGIKENSPVAESAIQSVVEATTAAGNAAAIGAVLVGATFSLKMAAGITAGSGAVANAGASAAQAGVSGAAGSSGGMYSIGIQMAFGLAGGISAGRSAAINAAISLAVSAINAARSALQISSPSRVFRGIGYEIAQGMAQGIQEGGLQTLNAVNEVIDGVIQTAIDRMGREIGLAQGASRLFDLFLPGNLPGQPGQADIQRSLIAVRDAIASFVEMRRSLNEEIADLNESVRESRELIKETRRELARGAGQRAADVFARSGARADVARQRVDLSGLRSDFLEFNRDLARQIVEANKAKPGDRTAEQRQLLGNRARSLDPTTEAGRQNRRAILDAGQQIRDFAQQLLAAGTPISEVTAEVRRMRNQLIAGTRAAGLNQRQVEQLMRQLGLTDEQLRRFRETVREEERAAREEARKIISDAQRQINEDLRAIRERARGSTDLRLGTEAGRRNRTNILDALQSIRDFGRTLLEAGTPVSAVVARMKELRNQLFATLRAQGFNNAQLLELARILGLTNEQLEQFRRETERATQPAPVPPGQTLPPPIINIYPPYGDPEAIGLTAVNRVAALLA